VKILYTVQRYGLDIVGGSEAACRMFAEHLVERGHDVEVLTSCARRYTDWADEYEPGTVELEGVTVHRMPVVAERSHDEFAPLNDWTIHGPWPMPSFQQTRWADVMGPRLRGQRRWLSEHTSRFDAVIHMTYMYGTTTSGLTVTAGRVPTILQPTAHDEPALWVRRYDTLFRLADAFMYFTPEEREIVERRFSFETLGTVIGIGMEIHDHVEPTGVRERLGLGDDPYLVYVGRIDPAKGAVEAWGFFDEYKRRNPGRLKLVLVGDPVVHLPDHPDVIRAGFLSEIDKRAALAGSLALLQPSYFESFSIVLCEAWLQRRPALVQRASEVLTGQAHRSGGAIPYSGFAEFEAAVDLLLERPVLADHMGESGRRYVIESYAWPRVIDQVEHSIELARGRFDERRRQPFTAAGVHATRA
jgi:glycosyltransferase involved in cell wall biosynthesis